MKLITKEVIREFKKHNKENSKSKDPLVIAKFFNPAGRGSWYATQFNEKKGVFYGYVTTSSYDCDEFGSFSLEELENFEVPFGLKMERDKFFQSRKLSEIKQELYGKK